MLFHIVVMISLVVSIVNAVGRIDVRTRYCHDNIVTTINNDYFVVSTSYSPSLNCFGNKLYTVLISLAELFDMAWFETSHMITSIPGVHTQYQ